MLVKGLRRITALGSCALIGGCTLVDPYVKVDSVHISQPEAQGNSAWDSSHKLLKLEHDSAIRQAAAYLSAAKDQARLKTGLALGEVPLGAAVVTAAAAKVSGDFPLIGGGISAAGIGLGGLLSSPARQAIYLQAQTATLCAMDAYDVYFISNDDYTKYLSDQTTLAQDIIAVTEAQNNLKDALAVYEGGVPAEADAANAAEQAAKAAATSTRKKKKRAPTQTPAAQARPGNAPGKPPVVGGKSNPAAPSGKIKTAAPGAASAEAYWVPAAAEVPDAPAPAPPPHAGSPAPPPKAKPVTAPKTPPATQPVPPTPGEKVTAAANGVKDLVNDLLSRAGTSLTAASATQASLSGVRERVDEAGRSLGDRRMAIKTQVDQNIQTTELTVDQIKAAISASALASPQASPSSPTTSGTKTVGNAAAQAAREPTVQSELSASGLEPKMDDLNAALDKLESDKMAPDIWLQRELQKEHDATQVGTCTVSAQMVLTATPDNPAQVSSDKALKIQIHAPETGGAPTYTKVEDGLTATMTTGGGYNYTLTITESASAKPASKDQTVVVSSGSQSVKVPFTVTNSADAATSGGGGSGGGPPALTPSTMPPPGAAAG